MAKTIKWVDGHIVVEPTKRPKKITGTHFPIVLDVNPYQTPFETWCRCTRTYEKPFEGNKYTNAGQVIEPKVFEFLRTSMGYGNRLVTPEDVYGKDHFQKTWGDFYPDTLIYGGMWDALILDECANIETVVEIKTVQVDGRSGSLEKRWKDGQAPDYQALQASLYAYLLGVDDVMMVSVSLKDSNGDYEHPELVVPSYANENVYIDEFKVSERYPNFDLYIEKATDWWNRYVLTGTSPDYDEKRDAEILKALRTNSLNPTTDVTDLVSEAEQLKSEIDKVLLTVKEKEKRLKALNEQIKQYATEQFRDGDTKVEIKGSNFTWTLSKTIGNKFDEKTFKENHSDLYAEYIKPTETLRLTISNIKEDK